MRKFFKLVSEDKRPMRTSNRRYVRENNEYTVRPRTKRELEKIKPTIIAENYIGGNNHGIQSLKSDFTNPEIHNASKAIASIPPKRSFIEIASWIFGIVVAIIAIYEFIIK